MGERIDCINENLSLIQLDEGLTFGTDAYLLAAFLRKTGSPAVELGGGTGVVSLLCLSREKFSCVRCVEIQEDFASLIRRNASINGFESKLFPVCSDIRALRDSDVGGKVGCVFANPPYMKETSGKANAETAKNIARHEIFGGISDFCACAARLLHFGGMFYTVYRPDRISDLFAALRENKFEPKKMIFVYPSENSAPCLVLTASKLGAKSGCDVLPPLIIYKTGTTEYTDKMKKIYETCAFDGTGL